MGRIAKLLSFVRGEANGAKVSDVKADPGGSANVTAQHFASPGDDSHPLPGDYVAMAGAAGTGRENAVGYLDPKNEQKAQAGDKRIYARDGDGAAVVEVWLKNDGTAVVINANGSVTLRPDGGTVVETPASTFDAAASGSIKGDNGAGSFELAPSGTFIVNGVTIDPTGIITTPTQIVTPSAIINDVEAAGHNHDQANDSAGNSEQPVGPMKEP